MPAMKGVCQTDDHKKARLNSYQKTMNRRKELDEICSELADKYKDREDELSRGGVWVFVRRIVGIYRR